MTKVRRVLRFSSFCSSVREERQEEKVRTDTVSRLGETNPRKKIEGVSLGGGKRRKD